MITVVQDNQSDMLYLSLFLYVTAVCASPVTVWKERTPWLHWRGSMEDLRETLY